MIRYEIRGATRDDEDEVFELSGHLNSVNLPHDRAHVARLLELSERSFSGALESVEQRKYVFVLCDLERGRAAGACMVVAQLGRRDAPYIYLDVFGEERYSRTLDSHFHHQVLRIGFSYDGPTEIGGLIVSPEYRRAPERLGRAISYVRFLFIAAHRRLFRDQLLAELLPPLEPDGTSHLWEALGRRFTDMSYAEADRLSSENKDFISDLFPHGHIYATLLSPEAQSVIGEVGPETKGVEKMLRRVGFRYANRVDPFDGGPHFIAETDEVTLVRATRKGPLGGVLQGGGRPCLIARDIAGAPFFRAIQSPAELGDDGAVHLPEEAAAHLEVTDGDTVCCMPLQPG